MFGSRFKPWQIGVQELALKAVSASRPRISARIRAHRCDVRNPVAAGNPATKPSPEIGIGLAGLMVRKGSPVRLRFRALFLIPSGFEVF